MRKVNYILLILIIVFGIFYVFQRNSLIADALILEKEKNVLAELVSSNNNITKQSAFRDLNLGAIKDLFQMQEVKNISFLIIGPANLALEAKISNEQ